jgi:hypothetical protein
MKRTILILTSFLVSVNFTSAQLATDPNEGLWMTQDSPGAFTARWYGRIGRTYFIQTTTDLLSAWIYKTEVEPGENLVIPYGFTASSDKYFLRLKYTDIPTNDPADADFDGDGISNIDELNAGLDPLTELSNRDLDGDGLPDDWERFWFNGSLTHNGAGHDDPDGFTNAEEFQFGLNPNVDDSVTAVPELSYDALGRLETAGAVTYSYDAEGNIETAAN